MKYRKKTVQGMDDIVEIVQKRSMGGHVFDIGNMLLYLFAEIAIRTIEFDYNNSCMCHNVGKPHSFV